MVGHTPQTRQRLQHQQEYKQTSCTLLVTKDVWIVKQHATEPVGAFNTNKTRRRLQHQEAFQTDELHFPCDQRRLDNEQKRTNKPRSKNEHHNDKGRHKATKKLITSMKIAKDSMVASTTLFPSANKFLPELLSKRPGLKT